MERIVQLTDHDEARALFGARDVYLKIIRDACAVKVVARNGLLKIEGRAEAVERAFAVIERLLARVRSTGTLKKSEVIDVIYGDQHEETDTSVSRAYRKFAPRTAGQSEYVRAINENDIVFSYGPAGTGKTFIAVAMAIEALRRGSVRKIVLVRPVVEAGESLGFLPGDVLAKVNPYMRPLYDALSEMIDFTQLQDYMERDLIEIAPLAYMRGRTLNDAFVILDEAQNTSVGQMKMFLTRMGMRSKIVITGDITQIDLPEPKKSGMVVISRILKGIKGIAFAELTGADIVRHKLVQKIVNAYQRWETRSTRAKKGRTGK